MDCEKVCEKQQQLHTEQHVWAEFINTCTALSPPAVDAFVSCKISISLSFAGLPDFNNLKQKVAISELDISMCGFESSEVTLLLVLQQRKIQRAPLKV